MLVTILIITNIASLGAALIYRDQAQVQQATDYEYERAVVDAARSRSEAYRVAAEASTAIASLQSFVEAWAADARHNIIRQGADGQVG